MAKLQWDKIGEHFYETGVDHGVHYMLNETGKYTSGVAWNGLTGVTESPSGAESTAQYADNIKYLDITSAEEFGLTIEAFTYPDQFAQCDGSAILAPGVTIGQQSRKTFGFSYRTNIGNDIDGNDHGYKLHLVYGCKAAPSERSYATINDSPEAMTMSWEVTTTPVACTGHKPTSQITISSKLVDATKLAALETILYGSDTDTESVPRLPLPDEVITILGGVSGASLLNDPMAMEEPSLG